MQRVLRQSRFSLSRAAQGSRLGGAGLTQIPRMGGVFVVQRFNSTGPEKGFGTDVSVERVLEAEKGFEVSSVISDLSAIDLASVDAAAAIVKVDAPNFVVAQVMGLIDNVHLMAGIPYWEAIVVATVGIRLCLFPVALKTIQGAARMACMRPEMQKVQDALTKDPNFDDTRVKAKYQEQMQALFVKYKVNPLRAVMWPLFQFPVFIALFLALRDMGTFYPGFATGGAFWFIDLSMPDAWLILPIFNSLSFLAMIELGSDGVQVSQQGTFKWAMRGLGVAMVPLTMSMPQGLFIYWSTNNSISVIQTVLLKQKALREFFDIPEAPKEADTPKLKLMNPMRALSQALEKERSQKANAKAEILEGIKMAVPGPPPSPPPVSFAMPPRKKKTTTAK